MARPAYSLKELTKPASEPVSLALVKNHLAVDHDDDDAAIQADITAARILCERHTGLLFGSRSLRLKLTAWPYDGRIEFPVDVVTSITSMTYTDTTPAQGTVDPSNWRTWLDGSPPILWFIPGFAYPVLELYNPAPLVVDFVAGDDSNNEFVAPAIKLAVGYWRKFPGGEDTLGHLSRGLPAGAINILDKLWTGAL